MEMIGAYCVGCNNAPSKRPTQASLQLLPIMMDAFDEMGAFLVKAFPVAPDQDRCSSEVNEQ